MEIVDIVAWFVRDHVYLGYVVLFFGMIIEGELWLMVFGLLANTGLFSFNTIFLVAFIGVLFNDVLFYKIGEFLRRRYGEHEIAKSADRKVRKYFPDMHEYPGKAIFISKFIAGINHPTLILLGFLGVRFRYFMKLQVVASFLWTLAFLSFGFLFGDAAIGLGLKVKHAFPIVLVLVLGYIVLEKAIKYIFKISKATN